MGMQRNIRSRIQTSCGSHTGQSHRVFCEVGGNMRFWASCGTVHFGVEPCGFGAPFAMQLKKLENKM